MKAIYSLIFCVPLYFTAFAIAVDSVNTVRNPGFDMPTPQGQFADPADRSGSDALLVNTETSLVDFLPRFWSEQFGLTYLPDRSGMMLQEAIVVSDHADFVTPSESSESDPLIFAVEAAYGMQVSHFWNLSVTDAGQKPSAMIVASGFFAESFRVAIPGLDSTPAELAAAGLSSLTFSAVSGLVSGSEGVTGFTYGMVFEVKHLDGNTMTLFIPNGVTADAASANSGAIRLTNLLDNGKQQDCGGIIQPQEGTPEFGCYATLQACCATANTNFVSCHRNRTIEDQISECVKHCRDVICDDMEFAWICRIACTAVCLIVKVIDYIICNIKYDNDIKKCIKDYKLCCVSVQGTNQGTHPDWELNREE